MCVWSVLNAVWNIEVHGLDLFFHKLLEHLALEDAYLKFVSLISLTRSRQFEIKTFQSFAPLTSVCYFIFCFSQNDDLSFNDKTLTPQF